MTLLLLSSSAIDPTKRTQTQRRETQSTADIMASHTSYRELMDARGVRRRLIASVHLSRAYYQRNAATTK